MVGRRCRLELLLITLKILHTTTYRFNERVSLLPHRLMLRPRESRELRLISSQITVVPDAVLTWAHDVFGNAVATAAFQMAASNLVITSVAELELDAVAWPVFDIAFSAMSYPFRYSDDDWIDLGALAVPQFADAEGILRNWAQMFVRGTRTDTLSLLKDLSFGVSEAVRYQTREDVRYSNAYGDAKSWLGLMPGFRRAVHRSSAHARVRGKNRLRLSSQSEPTERGIERCRIDACVGGGLRTGSRLDHFRSDEPQRRRLQPNPRRVARDIRQTIPVSGSHW